MRHTAKAMRQDPFGIDIRDEAPRDELSHPAFTGSSSSFDDPSHN